MLGNFRLQIIDRARLFPDRMIIDLNPKELALEEIGEDVGRVRGEGSGIGMKASLVIKLPDLLRLLLALYRLVKLRERHPQFQRPMFSLNPLTAVDDEMNGLKIEGKKEKKEEYSSKKKKGVEF